MEKRQREEKEEEDEPANTTKRRRVASGAGISRTSLAFFLEMLMLEQQPHHNTCKYIDPALDSGKIVTRSVNISMLALITCSKYNIPIEVLMRSWWRTVAQAKALYWDKKLEKVPPAEKINLMWQKLTEGFNYCYDRGANNFLYDLHIFGRCQCSCGVIALREIMLQVDPEQKTWYAFEPNHILLGTEMKGQPVEIETTESKPIILVDPNIPYTRQHFVVKDPNNINAIHANEWIRNMESNITWNPATKTAKTSPLTVDEQVNAYAALAQKSKDAVAPNNNIFQNHFFQCALLCLYAVTGNADDFEVLQEYLLTTSNHYKTEARKEIRDKNRFDQLYVHSFWYTLGKFVRQIKKPVPG